MKKALIVAYATVAASLFAIDDTAIAFIQRGGNVRLALHISPRFDNAPELLNIGEEVRHVNKQGLTFVDSTEKHSFRAINIAIAATGGGLVRLSSPGSSVTG